MTPTENKLFPDNFPDSIEKDGDIVGVGGNLSEQTLLSAYSRGVFPWFLENQPILWWCPDPRFVLFPSRFHVSGSLQKQIRRSPFELTLDRAFEEVVSCCQNINRPGQKGTWITSSMQKAYIHLHRKGYAHSVEAWNNGTLVGGAYGVSLGRCFFGESMFSLESGASKIAFTALVGTLIDAGFETIDCQVHTQHLESFGAANIPRNIFLKKLCENLKAPSLIGNWSGLFPQFPDSACFAEILDGRRINQ